MEIYSLNHAIRVVEFTFLNVFLRVNYVDMTKTKVYRVGFSNLVCLISTVYAKRHLFRRIRTPNKVGNYRSF